MLDAEAREDLIERITAIFTNEADAREFNEDPEGYTGEHLPEGTEGADVAGVLPEVGHRTGLDFSNVASTGGGASAAGELSHTYQTIYQQNSFIYAEEGSQVTNIQGNGNAVAQQDIDVDVDYGHGDTDELPEEETPETPEEPTDPMDEVEHDPTGGNPGPLAPEDPMDPVGEEAPMELPEEPPMEEAPAEEAPAEAPDPMEGMEV
ncbi:hypothetical protein B7486_60200 [cyanobacterium TDX16]|nr:hypothetical protein B7486_60200 [cyanobacterium TDX16]